MPIVVEVQPKDNTFVGWDVRIASWKTRFTEVTWHVLTWSEESSGVFTGTSKGLSSGEYFVHAFLADIGREVEISVRGNAVVKQPTGKDWPMKIKVNGAVGSQTSDTWYFEYVR